jgi:hypothetical protein
MKSGMSSFCVMPVSGRASSGWRHIGFMLLFFTLPFTLSLPSVVTAEEIEQKPLEDRLTVRGGWAYVWGANSTITVPGPNGIAGTSLDYSKTLGGDSTTNAFRVDALWRFNEKHAAQFAWYRVAFSGQNTLQEQIVVDGTTIAVGASTNSSLSFNMYRAMYQYSFYRNEKVELAVVPGLYLAKTHFSLAANGLVSVNGSPLSSGFSQTNENLTLPLPSIGVLANYQISPKLLTQIRTDFFYLQIGNFEGSMMEFYAGLEYRLFKPFALGAAYDRLVVNAESTSSNGFRADVNWNLLYLYATLYLF